MDLVLIIFGGLLLGIGLPVLTLLLLRKWLLRRNYRRSAAVAASVLVVFLLFCGYVPYSFIYPPDSTFESAFVEITGVPYPASGEVITGDESGLDFHGDYISCARLKISATDYKHLLKIIRSDTSFTATDFTKDSTFIGSEEYFKVTKNLRPEAYYETFSKGFVNRDAYRFIGFSKDGRTVIIYRCSS